MTRLTLAARNYLVQTPEIKALISSGKLGNGSAFKDGWIFTGKPYATIEKYSYKSLIVVTETPWSAPNAHNTMEFPMINVDIWASPHRMADGTPIKDDADLLIEEVMQAMKPYLHTINLAVPGNADLDPELSYLGKPGDPRIWGTENEIRDRTGVLILASQMLNGPVLRDVQDGNGARMGRYTFGIHTA